MSEITRRMKKNYHPDRCTRLISEKFQSYMERGNQSKHFNLINFLKEQNCTSGILCIMFFVCFLYFSHFDILFAFFNYVVLFTLFFSFFCFWLLSIFVFHFLLFLSLVFLCFLFCFLHFFSDPNLPFNLYHFSLPIFSPLLFLSALGRCTKKSVILSYPSVLFAAGFSFTVVYFFKSRLRGLIVTG